MSQTRYQLTTFLLIFASFFQNEDIFVQLDELDKLDKIAHA